MAATPPGDPVDTPPAGPRPTDAEARLMRAAAALRDNLRRRKEQSRARQDAPPVKADPDPDRR